MFIFYCFTSYVIIFGLKSMIKQLLDIVFGFFHLKCIIKQSLDEVYCDMQNYQCLLPRQ